MIDKLFKIFALLTCFCVMLLVFALTYMMLRVIILELIR
jgi:hypothetical protein